MSSDWPLRKISSLGKVITGKTPPTKDLSNFNGKYPFITIPDLDGRIWINHSTRTLSDKGANLLKSHALPENSVMMSCIATIGKCGITTTQSFTNQQINSVICAPNVDPLFLFYSFKRLGREMEAVGGGGSVYTNVSKTRFSNIEIPIPTLNKQRKIAKILGDLDKKIQLNRQINQTLEQIAQAIFKSWFVDFDPVKAKIQARQNNRDPERAACLAISGKTDLSAGQAGEQLDALSDKQRQQLTAIAALFPDALEDSELGEIPRGWGVKPLPELIDFLEGPGIRNWQYTEDDDGIKFINIRCIQNGDLQIDTASKITKEEAFGKYAHFQLAVDDIVVSTSGTLGRFAFIREEHLPLSLNTSVIRFRPIEGQSTLHFIRGFVETQLQWELEIRASGSAQRNFGPMHLKQITMLQPNVELLNHHAGFCAPLFKQRQSNLKEIDSLTAIRDSLLPKLLSGEITIESVHSTVEAVA